MVSRRGGYQKSVYTNPAYQPALTRVCRQVREETLPIFYGQNTFVIIDIDEEASLVELLETMQAWLKMIGPGNVSMLSSFKISLGPEISLHPPIAASTAEVLKDFSDAFVQAGGKSISGVAELLAGCDPECLGPYVEAN